MLKVDLEGLRNLKKIEKEKTAISLLEAIEKAKEEDEKKAAKEYKRKTPTKEEKLQAEYEAMLHYHEEELSHEPEKKKDPDEWDVKIGDPITYFDASLSYELTGYRPITLTEGLDFNPKLFTEAADKFRRDGRYTDYVPETFMHRQHWEKEYNRCKYGLTIGRYTLTGENYFWLNYYRLLSAVENGGEELRNEDFPAFINKLYEYFHYLELCRKAGFDGLAFKGRGIGASEIAASNCAHAYTFHKASRNIITACMESQVSKTLGKVWLELDFLNTKTENAFRRLSMAKNTAFFRRSSYIDEDGNEGGFRSEIEGITADLPKKLRGDRTNNLYFEECFAKDTLVVMPDFSRKPILDIKVGDFVMGIDGTPLEVVQTCSGIDDLYKVKQQKGEDYIVNSKHLIYTQSRPRTGGVPNSIDLITPLLYFDLSKYAKRTHYGLKSAGVNILNQLKLNLDPYYLGAWLGDGFHDGTSIIINETDDPEIRDFILDYFSKFTGDICHISIKKSTTPTLKTLNVYSLAQEHRFHGKNPIYNELKSLNLLYNKHLPQLCLSLPMEDRLQILAGLIDTDGSLKKGSASYSFCYEITMSRKQLIQQIAELARSCGFYPFYDERISRLSLKPGETYYRVVIRGDLRRIPVKVKRKKVPDDYLLTSNPLSTAISVESIGEGVYYGITLKTYGRNTDHLFLLNDYTIVHNCGTNKHLISTYIESEALVKIGGRRVGNRFCFGCVCAGTKVYKNDGTLCNIEDLRQEDGILGWNVANVSKEPITYMQEEAYKKCVEITTEYGTLQCSEDHPILLQIKHQPRCKDNYNKRYTTYTYEFVPAIKLTKYLVEDNKIGRRAHICMADQIDCFGIIHNEHARMIGMLIGDGTYNNHNTPVLSNCDKDIWNYVESRYEISGNVGHITKDGREYKERRIKKVTNILREAGIYGQVKQHKRLPSNIWNWDKWSTAELIAGLFDTNGYINGKEERIDINQSSKELLIQLKELLKKFGVYSSSIVAILPILSHNRKDRNVYYRLCINDKLSFYNFKLNFSLLIQYKREALNKSSFKPNCADGMRRAVIRDVKEIGIKRIYNLCANKTHSYIANDIITHNTSDSEGPSLAGLKKMFYNPLEYSILPFLNPFMLDGKLLLTGYFIPSFAVYYGTDQDSCFKERGVVDENAAKKYYLDFFETKKDPTTKLRNKAEYCFTPEDGFLLEGENRFDREKLVDRLQELEHGDIPKPLYVKFKWPYKEGVPDRDEKPTIHIVENSKILISEMPITDDNDIPYANLYLGGIDSIDSDATTSTGQDDVSDFCMVILRRLFGLKPPKIVAIYKDRPKHIQEAFDTALLLCLFYNCKALFEATRVSIKTYFERFKKLDYLMHRPKATSNTTGRTNLKLYGVPATPAIIDHQLDLIEEYIDFYSDQMDFVLVIDELLRYSYENKRKFDIVAALGMVMLANEEYLNKKVRTVTYSKDLLDVGYYKDEYGRTQWGIIKRNETDRQVYGWNKEQDSGYHREYVQVLFSGGNRW